MRHEYEHRKFSVLAGDLQRLVGKPILLAEQVTEDGNSNCGDAMWTFYKLSTVDESVTIRWFGESNGYYSVSVNFDEVKRDS